MSRTIERDLDRKLRNIIGTALADHCELCEIADVPNSNMVAAVLLTLSGFLIITAKTGGLPKEHFLKMLDRQWDKMDLSSDPLSQNRHENEK